MTKEEEITDEQFWDFTVADLKLMSDLEELSEHKSPPNSVIANVLEHMIEVIKFIGERVIVNHQTIRFIDNSIADMINVSEIIKDKKEQDDKKPKDDPNLNYI